MDYLGHVALTDFGLSKENVTDVRHQCINFSGAMYHFYALSRCLIHSSPHSVALRNTSLPSSLRGRNMVPPSTGGRLESCYMK